jgi:hypothetical protein
LAASLFLTSPAPNGKVSKANGTSNFVGTIYADEVNLVGTTDLSLDSCFLANLSPRREPQPASSVLRGSGPTPPRSEQRAPGEGERTCHEA